MTAEAQNIQNFGNADQRYFPRWEVANRVVYQLENQPQLHEATTRDLSCTGLCLSVDKELVNNQQVNLTVYLTKNQSFKAKGKIIWIKSDPLSEKSTVGVLFSDLSEKAQDLILNHAFEINPRRLHKKWFEGWSDSP